VRAFRKSPQPGITTFFAVMRRIFSRYVSIPVVFCSQLPSVVPGEDAGPLPALI